MTLPGLRLAYQEVFLRVLDGFDSEIEVVRHVCARDDKVQRRIVAIRRSFAR